MTTTGTHHIDNTVAPEFLYELTNISTELKAIAAKVIAGKRITTDEGVLLFEQGELGCQQAAFG